MHEDITKGLLSELYVDTARMSHRELTAEAISALDILVENLSQRFRGDSCDLKAPKEDADYQVWSENPGKACRNCWRYREGTCSAVSGIINPDGACELWEMSESAAPSTLEIIHVPVEVVQDEPELVAPVEIDWDAIANYQHNGISKQDSIEVTEVDFRRRVAAAKSDGDSPQICDRNDAQSKKIRVNAPHTKKGFYYRTIKGSNKQILSKAQKKGLAIAGGLALVGLAGVGIIAASRASAKRKGGENKSQSREGQQTEETVISTGSVVRIDPSETVEEFLKENPTREQRESIYEASRFIHENRLQNYGEIVDRIKADEDALREIQEIGSSVEELSEIVGGYQKAKDLLGKAWDLDRQGDATFKDYLVKSTEAFLSAEDRADDIDKRYFAYKNKQDSTCYSHYNKSTPLHMLHWNGLDIGFYDQDERHGFIRDSHAEVLLGDYLDSDQIWQVRTDDAESYVIGVRSKQQAKKLFSSDSDQPIKGITRVQPKDLLVARNDAEEEEDFPAMGLQSLGLAFAPLLEERIDAAYQVLLRAKTIEDFRARISSLYGKYSRKNTENALYQHLLLTNLRGREEVMESSQEDNNGSSD